MSAKWAQITHALPFSRSSEPASLTPGVGYVRLTACWAQSSPGESRQWELTHAKAHMLLLNAGLCWLVSASSPLFHFISPSIGTCLLCGLQCHPAWDEKSTSLQRLLFNQFWSDISSKCFLIHRLSSLFVNSPTHSNLFETPKPNAHGTVAVTYSWAYVQKGWKFESPYLAEVEWGYALFSCFSAHVVNKCPSHRLRITIVFLFLCCCVDFTV